MITDWQRRRDIAYRIIGPSDVSDRPVAAFDFDGTLNEYAPRRKIPQRNRLSEFAVPYLAVLSEVYDIAIFSNRSESVCKRSAAAFNLDAASDAANDDIAPIEGFLQSLTERIPEIRIVALASIRPASRKPAPEMWDEYLTLGGARRHNPCSFYCGDAAGRPGDFSSADRDFAHNIGLPYAVPEQMWGGENLLLPTKLPAAMLPESELERELRAAADPERKRQGDELVAKVVERAKAHDPICILLVGEQGSGKTTLARRIRLEAPPNLTYINSDTARLKFDRLVGLRRILVDNTNPSAEARRKASCGFQFTPDQILTIHVCTPPVLCSHLDGMRMRESGQRIPKIAHAVYHKNFEPPADAQKFMPYIDPESPAGRLHMADTR